MIYVPFRTRKRVTPTVAFYNPSALNAQIRNSATSTDFSSSAASAVTEMGFGIVGTAPSGSQAGQGCSVNWAGRAQIAL